MLGSFLAAGNLRANEIRFFDEVVDHLKEHGRMEVARHYESPYMVLNPQGVDGVFGWQQADELISILEDVPAMPL
jgi:type I restriction enzyme R subunit